MQRKEKNKIDSFFCVSENKKTTAHTIVEEGQETRVEAEQREKKKDLLCVITPQRINMYICLTRKYRRYKAQHHTHK